MSLLPSRGPETSTVQEGEMQVVGVDEDVEPVIDALSSETAREVLNAIYEEPATPSELAERLDMSIQKVSYHLDNLAETDLIAVAGTQYSEKGQEMTVYEPPDEPLVLFVGTDERRESLKTLVKRVLPTVGVLAVGAYAIRRFFDGSAGGPIGTSGGPPAVDEPVANVTPTEDGTLVVEEVPSSGATPTHQVTEPGGGTATPAHTATAPMETGTHAATKTPLPNQTPAPSQTAAPAPTPTMTPTASPTPTATPTSPAPQLADAAASGNALSPSAAFLLGGVTVLLVLVAWWAVREYA